MPILTVPVLQPGRLFAVPAFRGSGIRLHYRFAVTLRAPPIGRRRYFKNGLLSGNWFWRRIWRSVVVITVIRWGDFCIGKKELQAAQGFRQGFAQGTGFGSLTRIQGKHLFHKVIHGGRQSLYNRKKFLCVIVLVFQRRLVCAQKVVRKMPAGLPPYASVFSPVSAIAEHPAYKRPSTVDSAVVFVLGVKQKAALFIVFPLHGISSVAYGFGSGWLTGNKIHSHVHCLAVVNMGFKGNAAVSATVRAQGTHALFPGLLPPFNLLVNLIKPAKNVKFTQAF